MIFCSSPRHILATTAFYIQNVFHLSVYHWMLCNLELQELLLNETCWDVYALVNIQQVTSEWNLLRVQMSLGIYVECRLLF